MQHFVSLLKGDVAGYEGENAALVRMVPDFFQLMVNLMEDRRVSRSCRPLLNAAVAYFLAPHDVMPEAVYGAEGYADDLFLCAWVANRILDEVQDASILVDGWRGEGDVLDHMERILAHETELIGDKRLEILDYVGLSDT